MKEVVEIVFFELEEDVSEEQFQNASQIFQSNFVALQDGYVSRKLTKSIDGRWADIAIWRDMDAAQAVGKNMGESEFARNYVSLIKNKSIQMHHMSIIHG
ncbi:hypothetical protein [Schinkia azotoformans]|uniref:hypothetical protein n=1 Tax=Schinkia azotoformans TaxID=1454 RepID=UPI002DB9313D|nr:hypothetical protein [Schinkia azotoformans]MEC1720059.1 hypothetical protein [Schinkia azotoformans]MED4414225.1 hypothetical protein [Schinkia azotoformans]